jgi:hypothetical protein
LTNTTRYRKKLSQYADDTQIVLDGSEKSVRNTVNLLNNFTKISGLKVNYNNNNGGTAETDESSDSYISD